MSETPGVMGQMRPLPEPVNEDHLNSLLQLDRVVSSQPVIRTMFCRYSIALCFIAMVQGLIIFWPYDNMLSLL